MLRVGGLLGGVVAMSLCAGAAFGAGTKSIVPMPYNANPDVGLTVTATPSEARIGEMVEICYSALRAGHVTLWDIGTSGRVARLFPNAYSGRLEATRVDGGGVRQCKGSEGDAFQFRVDGPVGQNDLYMVWTATPESQPRATGFDNSDAMLKVFATMRDKAPDQWASEKTSFNIVGPNGAVAPTMPPAQNYGASFPGRTQAQAGGRVFILAMGSNVTPLTKSNQDAKMFVDSYRRLFSVPDDNIRLISNVRREQFKRGFEWLRSRATVDDFVVIYYSGHGAYIADDDGDEADGKDEAFVTYDVQGKTRLAASDVVRDDEFAEWVGDLRTSNVLSVIDACHSGGLSRGIGDTFIGATPKFFHNADLIERPGTGVSKGLTLGSRTVARHEPKGVMIAAAREDQSALEGEEGSLFTLALLRSLASEQRGTMTDAVRTASDAVQADTKSRQIPVVTGTAKLLDSITFKR